jgi:hypothetical protein
METILMLGGALIAGLFILAAVHDRNRRGRRHVGTDGSTAIFSDGSSGCDSGSDAGCSDGGGGGGD